MPGWLLALLTALVMLTPLCGSRPVQGRRAVPPSR
jgi:hypothetical protein